MKGWLAAIEKWLSRSDGKKRGSVLQWLLLLGLAGAALMLLQSWQTGDNKDSVFETNELYRDDVPAVRTEEKRPASEERLEHLISLIAGVGEVEVLIEYDASEEMVVEKNVQDSQQITDEQDRQGGTRRVQDVSRSRDVAMQSTGGNQVPIVTKRIQPTVRGVLVVAGGAEDLLVKKMIVEAVEKALDVPAHRIAVMPRKPQN